MWLNVLAVGVTLLYPLALWLGRDWLEPRWLAGLLLLVALARLPALRTGKSARWIFGAALVLAYAAAWSNAMLPLKLYPAIVNATLLAVFAGSLATSMPVIERLARLTEPDLPPHAVAYTRRVTQAWCVFFVFNGAVALGTALWATDATWWLYNGVIAYVLMGAMFAGELLIRRRVRRAHEA